MGCAGLLALTWMAGAAAQELQIRYAEQVAISAAPGRSEFDAYGRHFALELAGNDRLTAKMPVARKSALAAHRFLRGSIVGVPGSWARISAVGGRLEGAMWDGGDLYVIASLSEVETALSTALPGAPDNTVIYRLSDTVNLLPRAFCAASGVAQTTNGLTQYKGILKDIAAQANAATIAYEQLDVALIADSAFQASMGANTEAEMLARLNTADGIFGAQLNLLLNATEVRLVSAGSDPFTETDPDALLAQVSSYRSANLPVAAAGVAHLVTAKSLPDNVLGIARIGTVCSASDGVSLSIGTLGSFQSGLVMAHEIGHNLGAVHDGEGECANVGPGFIMWPTLNGASRFSQCSLTRMRATVDGASCITPTSIADVSASVSAPTQAQRNVPFTLLATLNSSGSLTARAATLTLELPGDVFVDSLVPSSGTCTAGSQPVCSFGDVAGGDQRTVTATLHATAEGSQRTITVEAGAANDRLSPNNRAFTVFSVVNSSDAEISVSPGALTVRDDDPVEYTVRVAALRSQPTGNVHVWAMAAGLQNATYTPSVSTCTVSGDCSLGTLAPGQVATIVVRGIAYGNGEMRSDIRLDSLDDTNGDNNFTTFALTVNPRVNVGVDRPFEQQTLNVGDDASVTFTVRNTLGLQTASNVQVTLFADAWTPLRTAAVSAGSCVIESVQRATCTLGSLAPGDTRAVTVGVHAALLGSGTLTARAGADRDDFSSDNETHVGFSVRNPVDLRVNAAYWDERVEGREVVAPVAVTSNSTQAATDFLLTIDLAAGSHLTSLALPDTTCTILDPRHGRCTAATLAHQPTRTLSVGAVGETPGPKSVHVAISATSEADPGDNDATFDMRVAPYTDVAVTPYQLPEVMFVGQVYEFETRLRTAYRDVSNVMFTVSYPVELDVTPPSDLTGCTIERPVGGQSANLNCLMPTVAANTDRPLRFQARPTALNLGTSLWVEALSTPDVDQSNNEYHQTVRFVEDSDLVVDVAGTSASGTAGSTFKLPLITLRSPKDTVNMVVKVPIPSFATVQSVSSGWICTGTAVLECTVFALTSGTSTSFDITLLANSAGTFTSHVEVTAGNDANLANNQRDIAITVAAAAGSGGGASSSGGGNSSGGSSGGGGGGSMEWLGVAFLGLLVLRRLSRRGALPRPAHAAHH